MALEFLKKHGFDMAEEIEKITFGPRTKVDTPFEQQQNLSTLETIVGVRLPERPYLWDIHIAKGRISGITPHDFNAPVHSMDDPSIIEARGCLMTPSLCHAHIHLDKCFLLQDPKFGDLQVVEGDFAEAMNLTSSAKERFSKSDLFRRGRQLIVESIQAGVTAMRAFCELDGIVGAKCLDVGLELRKEFAQKCKIQICAFAQLPAFSGEDDGTEVRRLLEDAAMREDVEVVGSTPYVEEDENKEMKNLEWIIDLALKYSKLLDLHLDYHLDEKKRPLIWDVARVLRQKDWSAKGNKQVTCGHCTRLSSFKEGDWARLKEALANIPISFVGLPTSDLFMMRTEQNYRGSLNIPELIQKHGMNGAIAVNNVGNAFTPQGNCDPLSIASLGVGLYSAGTKAHTNLLFDCVSCRAKAAIACESAPNRDIKEGDLADFVIFEKSFTKMRTRKSIAEVVYDPPAPRIVIKNGIVVSR